MTAQLGFFAVFILVCSAYLVSWWLNGRRKRRENKAMLRHLEQATRGKK
jgi:hypothetical protein